MRNQWTIEWMHAVTNNATRNEWEEHMPESCEHLRNLTEEDFPQPNTPNVCEDCVKEGTRWVSLRECKTCGHVGCCDSSPRRHATKHFHETKHPVMRSVMPGESWTWCYVDEVAGELAETPTASAKER